MAMADSALAGCRIAVRSFAFPMAFGPVGDAKQLNEDALAGVFDRARTLDFFLIGAGRDPWLMPDALRQRFRDLSLSVDTMPTGAAVRTYNILLAENRRVGAGLIAVA
jgi:uncharacterized protein